MKCLMKYQWVKLPRNHVPEGKGIMGAWARLASRAAFRKGQASYCGYSNAVSPGMWDGGVVGLKSILGLRSRAKALGMLDALSEKGFVSYELVAKTKKLTYQITDWVIKCSGAECMEGAVCYGWDVVNRWVCSIPVFFVLEVIYDESLETCKEMAGAGYHDGRGLFAHALCYFIWVCATESMEPTLARGSYLIGTQIYFSLDEGDIIIFQPGGRLLVKRIAAVPGDTIDLDALIYMASMEQPYREDSILVVPEDCYFVLGDNTQNSYDSRYWTIRLCGRRILWRSCFGRSLKDTYPVINRLICLSCQF